MNASNILYKCLIEKDGISSASAGLLNIVKQLCDELNSFAILTALVQRDFNY